jgi:serine protease Do
MPMRARSRGRGRHGTRRWPVGWSVGLFVALVAASVSGSGMSVRTARPGPVVSVAALERALAPSLVDTVTFIQPAGTQLLGSGIIVSAGGLVLTDYHVVRGGGFIGVRVGGQGEVHPAVVVASDPADDLALLQMEGAGPVRPAALGSVSPTLVGDSVMAIGNAQGRGVAPTAVAGWLLAVNRKVSYGVGHLTVSLTGVMEARAAIYAGDSGGALVDARGRVIGMIAAGAGSGPCSIGGPCPVEVAFATPISTALSEVHLSEEA